MAPPGQEAIAVSISASVLPDGLTTVALPVLGSMAKVAGARAAQVPQPIQISWLT